MNFATRCVGVAAREVARQEPAVAECGRILVAEYQPTMFRCKVLSVDNRMVSVGSTNFDNRSFRLNDESNLNVYDEAFAQRQVEIFERDLAVSRVVTPAQWQARPLWTKVMERLAAPLGPQL